MEQVRIDESIEIAVPAAQAWALLGDFGSNHRWMPAVTESAVSGTGAGATRRLTMTGGGYVDERQTARDDGGMAYRYEMFGGSVPVQDYESELSVQAQGAGCRVRWTATFQPVPTAGLDARALVTEVYRSSLAHAKSLLEAG